MLDERALRKPGFREGRRIKLADGQEWSIPKPRLIFKPKITSDGKVDFGGGANFGPEFDDQMDILLGAREAEPTERLRVKFEVAVRLLASNYNLAPDDFAELLVLEVGEPDSDARWDALTSADGHRPKTLARYLRLCARMAGETVEIDLEDAIGIASFLVATGQVPPVSRWVDAIIDEDRANAMEAFF